MAELDEVLQWIASSLSELAGAVENDRRSMRSNAETFRHEVKEMVRKPSSSPSPGR